MPESMPLRRRPAAAGDALRDAIAEPALLDAPPVDLGLRQPDAGSVDKLRGREVWLVHPWALRAPPADANEQAVVIGVYVREYHQAWPWPEARWRWVDAAMAEVAAERWIVDTAALSAALAGASRVRSVDDPHLARWLHRVARLQAAPALFPPVHRRCESFSRWWSCATRGLQHAEELL
jgi:deoxyribodipyrimidine photo-lyase